MFITDANTHATAVFDTSKPPIMAIISTKKIQQH